MDNTYKIEQILFFIHLYSRNNLNKNFDSQKCFLKFFHTKSIEGFKN